MSAPRRPGRARVVFDDVLWHNDLARATREAARVAEHARRSLEQHGAAIEELRRCEDPGPDGTRLPRCMKLYVPPPVGPWGFVFQIGLDE